MSASALVSSGGRRTGRPAPQPLLEPITPPIATLDDFASADVNDLRLAVGLGAQPDLGMAGVGRLLAQNLAVRLINPRQLFWDELRERPLATGLALGVAVGAYVGWEGITEGRMGGSYSFEAGGLGLGFSGWYDVQTGDWAGRARIDLSGLIDGQ